MRKTLVSMITGLAGMLILVFGLYIAKIGFGLAGTELLIATGLAFIGVVVTGGAIYRLSQGEEE